MSKHTRVFLSRDGVSWESAGRQDVFIRQVRWVGNRFIAVGSSGNPPKVTILESTDGYSWTSTATNFHGYGHDIAFNNQVWVLVAAQPGGVYTSRDMKNWTGGATDIWQRRVLWTGEQFIAVNQRISLSGDGEKWEDVPAFTQHIEGLFYQEGLYVAVAHWGGVFLSQDGVTWEQQEVVTSASLYGVTIHRGKIVVVGINGTILVGERAE